LVTDSLRYWVQEMHVDGFRFDPGTLLAREANGFHNRSGFLSGFLKACSQDPVLGTVSSSPSRGTAAPAAIRWGDSRPDGPSGTTSIATPYATIGARARATALRLSGHVRSLWSPAVCQREFHHRARQRRNFLVTLLLSQGTPMRLAGDAFARTQQGNNAYCQDNEISWVDWSLAEKNGNLIRFVQQLTSLRAKYPMLRRSCFLSTQVNPHIGFKEITWINASGQEMEDGHWDDDLMRCFGSAARQSSAGDRHPATRNVTLLIVFNSYHDVVSFMLSRETPDARWLLLIDTNIPKHLEFGKMNFATGDTYAVTRRSLLLFQLESISDAAIESAKASSRGDSEISQAFGSNASPLTRPAMRAPECGLAIKRRRVRR
jgi:glycogen operon protein